MAKKLNPVEAGARAAMYLDHATSALQLHHQVRQRGNAVDVAQSLSALQLQLTGLLGREFSYRLHQAGDPDFKRWCCTRPGERGTDDHVIPLAVLIDYLAEHPEHCASPRRLRTFLAEHLILAYVPMAMEKRLHKTLMRAQGWFRGRGDARQDLIWGRYLGAKRGAIARPGTPASRFRPLPAHADLHGRH